ncbi:unnamed protein product [Heligmosomoides polygyrus]|uniref:ZP domain-containing protein n=1 Tax=Heligmosomoides polygyrus TaxID=6339 RepID=A0A183GBF4_HELPZ|nr:unnamed protein product [Heligmosomoides polygyrus]
MFLSCIFDVESDADLENRRHCPPPRMCGKEGEVRVTIPIHDTARTTTSAAVLFPARALLLDSNLDAITSSAIYTYSG